jgi:hypothetical protein
MFTQAIYPDKKVSDSVEADLSNDLWETALSFLSYNDLANVRLVNKKMNTFAYLAGFFHFLISHPQATKTNTLAKYLLSRVSVNNEPTSNQVTSFFQDLYGDYFVNLLTTYQAIKSRLFGNHGEKWVFHQQIVEKKLYFQITQDSLVRECESWVSLARQVFPAYNIILGNDANQSFLADFDAWPPASFIVGVRGAGRLPPKFPLKDYSKLLEFLDRMDFFEKVWADMIFLHNVFNGFDFPAYTNLNQRILDLVSADVMKENITENVFIFISALFPERFTAILLITNPSLFSYFIRLPLDSIVFAIKHHSINFLKAAVNSLEIREHLSSFNYIEMSTYPLNDYKIEGVDLKRAAIILAVPEVIEKITDEDLLMLMRNTWDEAGQLLLSNEKLKNRMVDNLWFELIKRSACFAEVISKNKAIYDLLSPKQLKYLILRRREKNVLEDKEVICKLQNFLTEYEIRVLKIDVPASIIANLAALIPKVANIQYLSLPASCNDFYRHEQDILSRSLESATMPKIEMLSVESNRPSNKSNNFDDAIEYVYAGANILFLMSAASGVATFLVPQMLAAAIGFLGAALLVFSAYGVMTQSRHRFFPASGGSVVADPLSVYSGLNRTSNPVLAGH